jgi:hypothetical protein
MKFLNRQKLSYVVGGVSFLFEVIYIWAGHSTRVG